MKEMTLSDEYRLMHVAIGMSQAASSTIKTLTAHSLEV